MARILLSEADPEVRRLLVTLLEQSGHTTIVLHGGTSVPPTADLLLLDPSSQPRLQQAEIAREHDPALPVISVSALPTDARFLTRGPLSYLPKPFTHEQLRSTLESALAPV
jgi:CheY-like chemotaxis protein